MVKKYKTPERAPKEYFESLFDTEIHPDKLHLYVTALTHRSFPNENQTAESLEHNERLEFLGDAILEHVVTAALFFKYPLEKEGSLTSYRSALVKKETLAKVALNIGLAPYMRLSRGEEKTGGREKDYLLANTFEAVLGALYVDKWYAACETFVLKHVFHMIDEIVEKKLYRESKSYLQEKAQEIVLLTPSYVVESAEGPDHEKVFVMAVYFGDKKIATGCGSNKQLAQQDAAHNALELLHW